MIKAVFFDWFNTLAHYEPPREELQSQALSESGIDIPPQKIIRGLAVADREFFEENTISPIRKRDPEEQAKVYTRYQRTILTESGVDVSTQPEILPRVMQRVRELSRGMRFVLFGDVLPTVSTLKERKLTLGLLTNLDREMKSICHDLGLEPYLDFIITSGEVGEDKPKPPIFLVALERARVEASEAVHIGDQYKVDVLGARGVGINALLLDRHDLYTEVSDCPRIRSLTEVTQYLK